MHRQVRQNTTIQTDISLFQAIDKSAITQAVSTRLGIDARDPKGAKLTLALTTVTVGILARLSNGLFSNPEYTATCAVVTLGLL